MFTIDQIKNAHAKVKSGADFPGYIQEITALGVVSYDTFVTDGHSDFYGDDNFKLSSAGKYSPLTIAEESDKVKLQHYLKIHQDGETDYKTFCDQVAEIGVAKWTTNTSQMTCTYFNKRGSEMLIETIAIV